MKIPIEAFFSDFTQQVNEYREDILMAAMSCAHFDKFNVKDIADRHGEEPKIVRREIKIQRKVMAQK